MQNAKDPSNVRVCSGKDPNKLRPSLCKKACYITCVLGRYTHAIHNALRITCV